MHQAMFYSLIYFKASTFWSKDLTQYKYDGHIVYKACFVIMKLIFEYFRHITNSLKH